MTKTETQKILKKLDRIEGLLIKIIPQKTGLSEKDVLKIIKQGDKELLVGKARILHSLRELR